MNEKFTGMLSPYRVLDLTNEKGLLCGKLLGDLGADVIKIERPKGDQARSIGPFYQNDPDPEKSLFWFAFATSMRGITLDIEKAKGQDLFKELVKEADLVVESFPPGYMDELGLGYLDLDRINPGVIMVSITPFGQTGPYRDYKTSDIVAWALGGYMYVFGDLDRPPTRISHHSHAYLHAAGEAATAALSALYYREITGEGQYVDVSIHESSARLDMTHKWDMTGVNLRRGEWLGPRTFKARYIWPCKDGYMMWMYWMGPAAEAWTYPFLKMMKEEGLGDDFLVDEDWISIDADTEEGVKKAEEILARIEEPTIKYFKAHTKAELNEKAEKNGFMLYPVSDTKDLIDNKQLISRSFWEKVEHPELNSSLIYPGPFAKTSEAELMPRIFRRAPLVGEHNAEIYGDELGIAPKRLTRLKEDGII